MILQEVLQYVLYSLNYFMWSLKASVCACVTYIACNVMLCQHIRRPPQRLPHLDRMTHEQGTNLLILARQFNAIKLSSNKSVMIEVCPLYLLVKNCEPQIKMQTLLKSQDWNRGRGESAGTFARRYTANEWKKDYDCFLGFLELFSQSLIVLRAAFKHIIKYSNGYSDIVWLICHIMWRWC